MLEYKVTYTRGDGKGTTEEVYYPHTKEGQKRAENKAEAMGGKISLVEVDD